MELTDERKIVFDHKNIKIYEEIVLKKFWNFLKKSGDIGSFINF